MGRKRRSREFKNNSQVIDIDEARKQRLEKRRAEKKREEEKAREKARQNTRGKMAIRKRRNRRRFLTGLVVVCIIAAVGFAVFNVISLKKEQHETKQELEALEKEKKQLEKELSETNDPKSLEQQAREQLRLIKKGEYLYIFPEEITKAAKEAQQKTTEEE